MARSVRLRSLGLRRELDIPRDPLAGNAHRHVSTTDTFRLEGLAGDDASGLQQLTLGINATIMYSDIGATPPVAVISVPLSVYAFPLWGAASAARLRAVQHIDVRQLINDNQPAGTYTCRGLEIQVWVRAVDSAGTAFGGLPTTFITSFGPSRVGVGSFNLNEPGRFPDQQFKVWGDRIGDTVDIAMLQEVRDRRVADLVAAAAGFPHVAFYGDLAIVSRWSLSSVHGETVDPGPGRLDGRRSTILSAMADAEGHTYQIICNRWGVRDAHDVEYGPDRSAPGRLQAARRVRALVDDATFHDVPVIVGGDFNAHSSTVEMAALLSSFEDAFVGSGAPPSSRRQVDPIDFLMSRGPVRATSYWSCHPWNEPSDHPFVSARFEPA